MAQVTSVANGPWNQTTTWSPAVIPDFNSGTITINSNVNIPTGYSVTVDELVININRTLTIDNGGSMILTNGPGADLTFGAGFGTPILNVSGRIRIDELATVSNSGINKFRILNLGVYQHNYTASPGQIYAANWLSGSNLEITGYTSNSLTPTGLSQNFYNVIWNCPSQSSFIDLNGGLQSIANDFSVLETNGSFLVLTQAANYTLNIGNDFSIEGNSAVALNGFVSGTTSNVNVANNFNYVSTVDSWFSVDGLATMSITGDFTMNTATGGIDLVASAGGSGTGTTTIIVNSDLTIDDGHITNSLPSSIADIIFNGTNQNFTNNGTITDQINYIVNGTASVNLSSPFTGVGNFTLQSGGTIISNSSSGIESSGTGGGDIQVSGSRSFASGATIIYNGSAAQNMGDEPNIYTGGLNIQVNNGSGVTMEGNLVIANSRNLNINSGNLIIGSNTLTINGTVSGSGSLTANASAPATANLAIGGTGSVGTLNFTAGNNFINDLNYTSGNVVLGSDLNVSGTFIHSAGNLNFTGQTLTISGDYNNGGGTLQSLTTANSELIIDGTGTINTLNLQNSSNLSVLEINRSGTLITTPAAFSVNTLNILNGTFTHTGFMTVEGSVTRSGGGTLTNIPSGINTYSVFYTGTTPSLTTGSELPTLATRLINLVNNSTSTVSLGKNITVNGNVVLNSGVLSATSRSITMAGPNWTQNLGNFNGGTVNFNSTTTINGTATDIVFNNLNLTTAANITFPSTKDLTLTGNLTVPNLATIAVQPQAFLFSGGNNQTVSVNNKSINVLKVDKTGGTVTLQSTLRLIDHLEILSTTTFNSQSNLTLISTSAGATGNAYIAELPTGASVTGNVTVQRLVDSKGQPVWRHVTSPVSGVTLAALSAYFNTSDAQGVWSYDEALPGTIDDRWVKEPLTTSMTPGQGFIAAAFNSTNPLNWQMVGPVNQGIIDFVPTLSGSDPDNDGWNFTGNPYPSTIDWDRPGWTKDNVSNVLYIRDYDAGLYRFWDGVPGTSTLNDGSIATGQGFWVVALSGSPKLLEFTEEVKSTSTGPFFRKAEPEIRDMIAAGISDGKLSDKVFIIFDENGTENYDQAIDGRKMKNEIFNISTVSADNYNLCIDHKPLLEENDKSVFLNVFNFEAGTYTLFFDRIESINPEFQVYLIDHFSNEIYDLRDTTEIEFSVDPEVPSTFGKERFEVMLSRDFNPEMLNDQDPLTIYPNPAADWITIRFKNTDGNDFADDIKYNIFDPSSRALLLKGAMQESQDRLFMTSIDVSILKKGMYIVQIEAGDKNYYSKLLIH